MAYLIPENLPTNPDVPAAVQQLATAARDLLDEQVTVSMRVGEADAPLVIIDPRAGVLLLTVLGGGARGLVRKTMIGASKPSAEFEQLGRLVDDRATSVVEGLQRSPHLARAVPCIGAVAAPSADRATAEQAGIDPGGMLLREDLTRTGFATAIQRLLGRAGAPLTAREEKAVRAVVHPEIVIRDLTDETDRPGQIAFRAPTADDEDALAVLDRVQQNVAMNLGAGYRVIRGVAGSGKSLVLTFRARYLAERFPQWKILVTCYNVVLSKALEAFLAEHTNVTVKTLDSLAYAHGRRTVPKCQSDEDWVRLRQAALQQLRTTGGEYDVVLVDEGQDFDSLQFDLAYAALRTHRDEPQFLVVLDAAQNIYRKRSRWNPPGMSARGRTTLLKVNYRNTKEILELAYGMLSKGGEATSDEAILDDPSVVVPPEATSRRGARPIVRQVKDDHAEVLAVCDQIEKWGGDGIAWDDMLIVYGSGGLQRKIYAECTRRRIPYFNVSMSSKSKRRVVEVNDVVRSSTIHSIKGLEFSHVALCGVNHITTIGEGADDEVARRRLLYVGMTRATDHLFTTVSGPGSLGADLLTAAAVA